MKAPQTINPPRPATYQDVLDAPPHMVAEIVGGELHLHPRPAGPQTVAASALGVEIGSEFGRERGGPGGWRILHEPELHLEGEVVVPDFGGWRRERMPVRPMGPWIDLAPDWVCEVLSPSTRRLDLGPKRDIYARAGVGHIWPVDPKALTLEAFELRDGRWSLLATVTDADPVRLAPFDAIEFPLSALWPD